MDLWDIGVFGRMHLITAVWGRVIWGVSEKETYSGVCFKICVTMSLGVKAFRVHRTKLEKQSGTELSVTSEEVVWSFTLDLKVATFGCGHSFKAWLSDLLICL